MYQNFETDAKGISPSSRRYRAARESLSDFLLGLTPMCWSCERERADLELIDQSTTSDWLCSSCSRALGGETME